MRLTLALIALSACTADSPDLEPVGEAPPHPTEEPAMAAAPHPHPPTRRTGTTATYHGVTVEDPFDWLENPDDAEVKVWVDAQNTATRAWIDAVPARAPIADRLKALWQTPRQGVPKHVGGRAFYEWNDGAMNQPVLMMVEGGGEPRKILDPNAFSADGTASLHDWAASPDGRWLQYGVSEGGSDWTRYEVIDLATGQKTADRLDWIKFSSAAWLPDGSGFFYARYPETKDKTAANLHNKVYFHAIGTEQSADRLVYETPATPDWGFDVEVTDDGRWLVITVMVGTEEKSRVHVLDLSKPGSAVAKVLDAFDADYRVLGARGDRLFLRTSKDAPRYRIAAVDLSKPAPATLAEVVPQGDDVLEHAALVGDHLVLATLKDAHSELAVWTIDGARVGAVALPALGSVDGIEERPTGTETHFALAGFTQPTAIYRLDTATLALTPSWTPTVPFDPSAFTTEQVFVTSRDGARVPMFLTYKGKERPKDAPTLLYGYGGFNIPVTPGYKPRDLVWMELGGVYASANLRGGGEYGEEWHLAGTKTRKQNVFDDAIACGEWLVGQGVTRPSKLAIHGRSNGGLLAGAVIVQRPDLFGAAIPTVGVLDMLKYHTWTIGWAWASDYGTVEDEAEFKALLAYSPVHNAKKGAYPPVLIETADHDDRVVSAHSFKFAAALQDAQTGPAPILARIETNAGHGAGKSQAMKIDEAADELAFLVRALGVRVDGSWKP